MTYTQEQIVALVKRLRDMAIHLPLSRAAMLEAADMLEHLYSKNIRLREVLDRLSEKNRQLNLALKEKDHD